MKWLTRYIILFILVVCSWGTILGEGRDSVPLSPRDSSYVMRSPGADFLDKYKNDAHFDYGRDMTAPPGLWEWIKRWILERLLQMRWSESSSRVMDFVMYGFLIFFVGVLIFLIIKHRRSLVIRKRGEGFFVDNGVDYNGEQEGDVFSRMLSKAEEEKDFTLAVRVSYSGLLQVLDKKQIIRWEASKTNRDYVHEIQNRTWSIAFEDLSRIFDHVCYGEFPVDEVAYRSIRQYFADFRKEVEK